MKTRIFVALTLALIATSAKAELIERRVQLDFPNDRPDSGNVHWVGVDLENSATTVDPRLGAPGWHLRFRLGYISTNTGGAFRVETSNFASVVGAPTREHFTADEVTDPSGPAPEDTYNSVLLGWFEYFMFQGHLLAPRSHVYVVRTFDNHVAKIQMLDYVRDGYAIRARPGRLWGTNQVRVPVCGGNGQFRECAEADRLRDGLIHVVFRSKYNTVAGDLALEANAGATVLNPVH